MQITNNTAGPKGVNTVGGSVSLEPGQSFTGNVYLREKVGIDAMALSVTGDYTADPVDNEQRLAVMAGAALANNSMPELEAKIGKIRAGVATQAFVLTIGDSNGAVAAGAGNSTANLGGARAKNTTVALAARYTTEGLAASAASVFGEQNVYSPTGQSLTFYPTYDPRVAFQNSTGAFPDATIRTLGGLPFRLGAGTGSMTINPGVTWDRAILILKNRDAGTVGLSINGGASTAGMTPTTISTTAGGNNGSYSSVLVSKAAGTETLQIGNVTGTLNTGNQVVVVGAIFYNTAVPSVNFIHAGIYGGVLTDEYTKFEAVINAIDAAITAVDSTWGLDAVLLDMTINDANSKGVAGLSAFLTAQSAVVGYARAIGADVAISTPSAINISASTLGAYRYAILEYGAASGIPVADFTRWQVNYQTANDNGLFADGLHHTAAGYQVKTTEWRKVLPR